MQHILYTPKTSVRTVRQSPRNCPYYKIIRCTNLVFTYMMNTSKYDHFTLVVLTWSICCSSPVSCVCDVYPGLSPSASCLGVVASAATVLVVVTPIPGQSLTETLCSLSACAWGAGFLVFLSTHISLIILEHLSSYHHKTDGYRYRNK